MTTPRDTLTTAMDAAEIQEAVRRIAHEIVERNPATPDLVIVGIPTRGVELARRVVAQIAEIQGDTPELGIIDVSMHRDDLATRPRLTPLETTRLPVNLDGRTIVLVDDVLFTGRSCRAALDAITSFGRPARIQYAVLVDRGHRELPIHADYVGKHLTTAREDRIRVRLQSIDGIPDSVTIVHPAP